MTDPLLAYEGAVVGYAAPVAGPVSFAVARGEAVGLWGPNGCGKTTLLNALCGSARLLGGRIERASGLRVALQRQAPLPAAGLPLTGRDLLRLTGAAGALWPPGAAFGGRRLDRLSGGQLQFAQVWACIAAPVDLVLLDEPTGNLDPAATRRLEDALLQRRAGLGLLLVSHERPFLERVCTEIVDLAP
ncbi:MAG: ATP-binding cassette domain-containing protein [Pseudomonadota bacterium]